MEQDYFTRKAVNSREGSGITMAASTQAGGEGAPQGNNSLGKEVFPFLSLGCSFSLIRMYISANSALHMLHQSIGLHHYLLKKGTRDQRGLYSSIYLSWPFFIEANYTEI